MPKSCQEGNTDKNDHGGYWLTKDEQGAYSWFLGEVGRCWEVLVCGCQPVRLAKNIVISQCAKMGVTCSSSFAKP